MMFVSAVEFTSAHSRSLLALAIVLLGTFLVAPALAQSSVGHLAFYFDRDAEQSGKDVRDFTPFQVFLMAVFQPGEAVGAQVGAWEASIEVDPRLTVTGRTLSPSGALNLPPSGESDDYFVGLGDELDASNSPLVLVTYDCILLQPGVEAAALLVTDRRVTEVSEFSPAWLAQPAGEILPFDSWGAAVVNPVKESWGGVKEKFRGR